MERVASKPIKQRRAFSSVGGAVSTAGDATAGRALAAQFKVEPDRARALTHGFHSYAGRMHPTMARGAIERWSAPGQRVLDPFCGSGTVLVEAMSMGRPSYGIDASPLAVMISQVRSTLLGAQARQRLVQAAAQIAEESGERARKRRRVQIPPWAAREKERFSPHVALELFGLRELVMSTPADEIGQAVRLCFSSILVKFMRSGPEAPRDGETKRIGRGVPSGFFARRAEELARGLEELEQKTPPGTPPPIVHLGDARGYPEVRANSVDLIVSSPPYAGTYDYSYQHDTRFTWLGLGTKRFEEAQLGGRSRELGVKPREWTEGRRRWLGEMSRVLQSGGHAVLVVGDGVVGDRHEDAAEALADEGPRVKLAAVARASQERPLRDSRVREMLGPQQRHEHIVLLRKG
jgi:methylase of polypeptide subunit release factors